jgi:hypothetical protein
MNHQIITFDTLDALVNASREPSSWGQRDSRSDDRKFTGTASHAEACTLAIHGWAEGLSRMTASLDAARATSTSVGQAPAYLLDVCGAYPHAAIAATGDAFCMMAPTPVSERARPILRLATSTALPSSYEASEVFNYGAGLVAVIDALETAGFSVELQTVRCNKSWKGTGKERLTIATTIKSAGEVLDLERLAFCLGSASYNRRLHFGVVEARCPASLWEGSYGVADKPQHGTDVEHDVCVLPGPTMFPDGSAELASPEAAFTAMLPAITALLADRYSNFPALAFSAAA